MGKTAKAKRFLKSDLNNGLLKIYDEIVEEINKHMALQQPKVDYKQGGYNPESEVGNNSK